MCVYLPKQCAHYRYDFMCGGVRFAGNTMETSRDAAAFVESELKRAAKQRDKARREALLEQKKRAKCSVYFIRASEAVKVGWTRFPIQRRLAALRNGNHEPLRLIGTVPGGAEEERAIHAILKKRRLCGEWFLLNDDLLSRITTLVKRFRRPHRGGYVPPAPGDVMRAIVEVLTP